MSEKAIFAAGCFWGVEHMYLKHFKQFGISTRVGYSGGQIDHPECQKVKAGDATQHAEAIEIVFDPERVSYRMLVEFFYKMHDPTTLNAQGPDIGTEYRSAIFWLSEEQKQIAEQVTHQVQDKHYQNTPIVTEISPAGVFFEAEEHHQLYLERHPEGQMIDILLLVSNPLSAMVNVHPILSTSSGFPLISDAGHQHKSTRRNQFTNIDP